MVDASRIEIKPRGNLRGKFGRQLTTSLVSLIYCLVISVYFMVKILRLKCTKFDFGWGSAPDPVGETYSAPQTP